MNHQDFVLLAAGFPRAVPGRPVNSLRPHIVLLLENPPPSATWLQFVSSLAPRKVLAEPEQPEGTSLPRPLSLKNCSRLPQSDRSARDKDTDYENACKEDGQPK